MDLPLLEEPVQLLDPYERPVSQRRSPELEPPRPARRWGVKIALGLGLALSIGAATGVGMVRGERLTPPGIRGVWVTDTEKYAGRAVQFTSNQVIFFPADSSKILRYDVVAVRRRTQADGLRVDVVYGEVADPYTLGVSYRSDLDLRLVNQPEIQWRKQAAFPTPVPEEDTLAADRSTGKLSALPPELIYCITQVTQRSQSNRPVSCQELLARQEAALAAADSAAAAAPPADTAASAIDSLFAPATRR